MIARKRKREEGKKVQGGKKVPHVYSRHSTKFPVCPWGRKQADLHFSRLNLCNWAPIPHPICPHTRQPSSAPAPHPQAPSPSQVRPITPFAKPNLKLMAWCPVIWPSQWGEINNKGRRGKWEVLGFCLTLDLPLRSQRRSLRLGDRRGFYDSLWCGVGDQGWGEGVSWGARGHCNQGHTLGMSGGLDGS